MRSARALLLVLAAASPGAALGLFRGRAGVGSLADLEAASFRNVTAAQGAGAGAGLAGTTAGLLGTRNPLYICNTHAGGQPVEAWLGKGRQPVTGAAPVRVNTCKEFVLPLYIGDIVHLQVGQAKTTIFLPTDPIGDDGVVLFAVHGPVDGLQVKSKFFRRLVYPQVVALDVAGAEGPSSVEMNNKEKAGFKEKLSYDVVTPVDPGLWSVSLKDGKGFIKDTTDLHASMGNTYVILRNGPEQLMVYPDASSYSAAPASPLALVAGVALAAFLRF